MRLVFFLVLLVCCAGCGRADRQAVAQVMTEREQALAAADPVRYGRLLSAAYREGNKDRGAKQAELAAALKSFGPVAYRALDRTIQVDGAQAMVTGRYAMKMTVRGNPLELTGKEEIRLRKEPEGWKIVGGL